MGRNITKRKVVFAKNRVSVSSYFCVSYFRKYGNTTIQKYGCLTYCYIRLLAQGTFFSRKCSHNIGDGRSLARTLRLNPLVKALGMSMVSRFIASGLGRSLSTW